MDVNFKYAIGEEVTLRAMCSPFLAAASAPEHALPGDPPRRPLPQKMMVVERQFDECIGGVQLHYKVRVFGIVERGWSGSGKYDASVGRDLFLFTEFELCPWADVLATETK